MTWQALFGERSTTKIVAVFDSEENAFSTIERLKERVRLMGNQLALVHPHEKEYDKKIEPETRGIARTAVRAHLILGGVGFIVGVLVWAALYGLGWPTIHSSPGMAAIAIIFFTTIGGLLLGGLVTARPDHDLVIQRVRTAVENGKWSLVVHPRNPRQCTEAEVLLNEASDDVWRSI